MASSAACVRPVTCRVTGAGTAEDQLKPSMVGPICKGSKHSSGARVFLEKQNRSSAARRVSRGAQGSRKENVLRAALAEAPTSPASTAGKGKKAVVVGAGVGGLTMAGRLARAGYDVTLLEKNEMVGGRMQSFNPEEAPEYRFDIGPSLLLFPDKYRAAFEALGANMEDYVDVKRVEPAAYRAHFADGTDFDLVYDIEQMRQKVEDLEPGAGGKFIQWLGKARASLDLGVKAFIERDSRSALDFVNPGLVLPLALAVNPIDLLLSQFRQMSQIFSNPKLKALFSFQQLYVGLSPYNSPGVFSLLAATELTDGVWYPVGGFQKVRDAFQQLAEKNGVSIRLEACVEEVLVEGGAVQGVRLEGGEVLDADLVVANPDIPYVFDKLLKGEDMEREADRQVNKMDYSASVMMFCWSMKGKVPALLQHNVFLGGDYKASWDRGWQPSDFAAPNDPNFYVHNPGYTDPSTAPEGCDSVMILLPCANQQEVQAAAKKAGRSPPSREEMVEAGRECILRRLEAQGCGDLRDQILHEFVYDPEEWRQRYNITHGAVFGLAHGLLQLACFRPPTKTQIPLWPETPEVQGLHYVGASTRPGNGVPLVLMGVEVVYENIMAEQAALQNAGADN